MQSKRQKNEEIKSNKKNIFRKFFIKLCRIFGFEIIDQSNFSVPPPLNI